MANLYATEDRRLLRDGGLLVSAFRKGCRVLRTGERAICSFQPCIEVLLGEVEHLRICQGLFGRDAPPAVDFVIVQWGERRLEPDEEAIGLCFPVACLDGPEARKVEAVGGCPGFFLQLTAKRGNDVLGVTALASWMQICCRIPKAGMTHQPSE